MCVGGPRPLQVRLDTAESRSSWLEVLQGGIRIDPSARGRGKSVLSKLFSDAPVLED
jgi:hypothetical protein